MDSQINPRYEDEFLLIEIIDGIISCYTKKEIVITYEFAQYALNKRIEVSANQFYPIMNDIRNIKYITKEAMTLLNSEKGTSYLTAGAFIITSKVQEILGNFFIKYKNHAIPARVFTDKAKAMQWLGKYKV